MAKRYKTPKGCSRSTEVQSLLYSCGNLSMGQCRKRAKAWAKRYGFRYGKVECKSGKTCRLRQAPPSRFCKGTFRTITLSKRSGVKAVVAKAKK